LNAAFIIANVSTLVVISIWFSFVIHLVRKVAFNSGRTNHLHLIIQMFAASHCIMAVIWILLPLLQLYYTGDAIETWYFAAIRLCSSAALILSWAVMIHIWILFARRYLKSQILQSNMAGNEAVALKNRLRKVTKALYLSAFIAGFAILFSLINIFGAVRVIRSHQALMYEDIMFYDHQTSITNFGDLCLIGLLKFWEVAASFAYLAVIHNIIPTSIDFKDKPKNRSEEKLSDLEDDDETTNTEHVDEESVSVTDNLDRFLRLNKSSPPKIRDASVHEA